LHFFLGLGKFIKTVVSILFRALEEKMVDVAIFYGLGLALIVVGVVIMVAAIILVFMRGAGKAAVKGAGIIMIGPIPIIFGTDKKSVKVVLLLALALTIMLFVVIVVYYWLLR
jgi:uncharacterized protein (TIGR00304 family)